MDSGLDAGSAALLHTFMFLAISEEAFLAALIAKSACREGLWLAKAGRSLGKQCPARLS